MLSAHQELIFYIQHDPGEKIYFHCILSDFPVHSRIYSKMVLAQLMSNELNFVLNDCDPH